MRVLAGTAATAAASDDDDHDDDDHDDDDHDDDARTPRSSWTSSSVQRPMVCVAVTTLLAAVLFPLLMVPVVVESALS